MRFASLQFCLLLIATLLLAACGGSKSKNGETSLDGLWSVDQVEHKGRVEKVKGDNLEMGFLFEQNTLRLVENGYARSSDKFRREGNAIMADSNVTNKRMYILLNDGSTLKIKMEDMIVTLHKVPMSRLKNPSVVAKPKPAPPAPPPAPVAPPEPPAAPLQFVEISSPSGDIVGDDEMCVAATSWSNATGALCGIYLPKQRSTQNVFLDFEFEPVKKTSRWKDVPVRPFEFTMYDRANQKIQHYSKGNLTKNNESNWEFRLAFRDDAKVPQPFTLIISQNSSMRLNFEMGKDYDFRTATCQLVKSGTPVTCHRAAEIQYYKNYTRKITADPVEARANIPQAKNYQFTDIIVYDQRSKKYCEKPYSDTPNAEPKLSECHMRPMFAESFCESLGMRVPTVIELAYLATSRGAKGLLHPADYADLQADQTDYKLFNLGSDNKSNYIYYSKEGYSAPTTEPTILVTQSRAMGYNESIQLYFDEATGEIKFAGQVKRHTARVRCVK